MNNPEEFEGPHREEQEFIDYLERRSYEGEPPFYDPDDYDWDD